MNRLKPFQRRALVVRAGIIVAVFAGFSVLWIPITDRILGWLVQDPERLTRLATYKGSLYIGIVALFLFWLVLSALEATQEEAGKQGWKAAAVRQSLWAPLALFTAVGLLLSGMGYLIYQSQRDQFEHQVLKELAEHVRLRSGQIEGWLQERRGDALATARDPLLQAELRRRPSGARGNRSVLSERVRVLREAYDYDSVLIVEPEGQVVAASGGTGLTPTERNALADLGRTGPVTLAWRVQPGEPQGARVQASYLAAIGGVEDAVPLGVLVFRLRLDRQLAETSRDLPTDRSTLETLLVCQQGTDLVILNTTRLSAAPIARMPMSRQELVGVQALLGREGEIRGLDHRGVSTVAVAQRLASLPWVLFTKLDAAELGVPIRRLSGIFGGVGLLFLALSGIAFYIWRKRETMGILAERLRIQAQNQFLEYRLEFMNQHANDIVLLVGADGSIRYANDRAVEAYGYVPSELLELNVRDLRAPEDAGELSAQLADALEAGSVRFETVHRRRDGSTFPVEVSSRRLVLEDAPCVQSLIRRAVPAALRRSGGRDRTDGSRAGQGRGLQPGLPASHRTGPCASDGCPSVDVPPCGRPGDPAVAHARHPRW